MRGRIVVWVFAPVNDQICCELTEFVMRLTGFGLFSVKIRLCSMDNAYVFWHGYCFIIRLEVREASRACRQRLERFRHGIVPASAMKYQGFGIK